MATDKVTIFNQALSSVGTKSRVSSPTENSVEAEACNLWYDHVVETVLAAAPWHNATAHKRLALLIERDLTVAWTNTAPDPGYYYLYSAPSDMVRPRYLSTYARFVPTLYSATRAIATNTEDAILTYTKNIDNPNLWDPALRAAIISALAAHIAMPLTAKVNRAQFEMEKANNLILEARVQHANDMEFQLDKIPDWLQARGYGDANPTSKYYYPFGDLLSVSGLA